MNFVPLTFPLVDKQLREEYTRIIPKIFLSCLDGQAPFGLKSPVYGVGILQNGHAVGISLATAHIHIHVAYIHCISLENSYANEDLIEKLYHLTIKLLLEQGITFATFVYPKEDSLYSTYEKILHKNDWEGPRPFIIECLFKRDDFNPPWWHANMEIDKDFEEFFFENLTASEEKDIHHRFEQMSLPSYVFPFDYDKNLIEYKNSLGLRYKGRVVGWMITHRTEPNLIRYSNLYLEEDFAHTRYWLKLLIDSLRIHKKIPSATFGLLELNLNQISPRWLKFIEKKLFPHACKITHKQIFVKKFP